MMRHVNWLGNMRVDVPHLRLVESAVTSDLHLLAGTIMAGETPVVVRGFTIPLTGAIGNPATSLSLVTADGILMHATAAESGGVFAVSAGQTPEVLNASNAKVMGGFVPGTCYVGIDLVRTVEPASEDSVRFLSDATSREFSQTVPLARTLQYRIIIQTTDFDHSKNVLPVAKVVVNADGTVASITDTRNMAFRLARGGTQADAMQPNSTMSSRRENPITASSGGATDPFAGGDKTLSSLRQWMAFVMNRLWEVGGGEYWYSAASDRDVKVIRDGEAASIFSNGENFEWSGTDLHWKGLKVVFANSNGTYNVIQNQATDSAGLTDLAVGECVYVDLDRTQDRPLNNPVVPGKGLMATLGTGVVPGSRYVLAWRTAEGVYTRDQAYQVGQIAPHASTTGFGIVRLAAIAQDQAEAVVPAVDSVMRVVCYGITTPGLEEAALDIGGGQYDGDTNIGKSTKKTVVRGVLEVNEATSLKSTLAVTGLVTSGTAIAGNSPPTANNHLTRKDWVDTQIATRSPTGHNHDGVYALSGHTHTGADITDLGAYFGSAFVPKGGNAVTSGGGRVAVVSHPSAGVYQISTPMGAYPTGNCYMTAGAMSKASIIFEWAGTGGGGTTSIWDVRIQATNDGTLGDEAFVIHYAKPWA